MNEQLSMAFNDFLGLYEIGRMALFVDSSWIKSSSWLIDTSSADVDILPLVVLVSNINFGHKTLDNRNGPARMNLTLQIISKLIGIPCKLVKYLKPLFSSTKWDCQYFSMTEIEELRDVIFSEGLYYLLIWFKIFLFFEFLTTVWYEH